MVVKGKASRCSGRALVGLGSRHNLVVTLERSFGLNQAGLAELALHSTLASIQLQFAERSQLYDAVVVHRLPYP